MAVFVSSVSSREGYSDDDDDWIKWLRQAVARSGRRHGTRRAAECECRWLLPPFAVCAFHRISVMTHPAAASKGSSFNKHRLIVYAARPSSTIATLLLAEVFNVGFHLSPAIRSSTSIPKMRLVSLLFSCSFQTNHCLRLSIHNEWTFPEFDVLNGLGCVKTPSLWCHRPTGLSFRHAILFSSFFFFWREYNTNDVCLGLLNKLPGDGRVSSINQKKKKKRRFSNSFPVSRKRTE